MSATQRITVPAGKPVEVDLLVDLEAEWLHLSTGEADPSGLLARSLEVSTEAGDCLPTHALPTEGPAAGRPFEVAFEIPPGARAHTLRIRSSQALPRLCVLSICALP